MRRSFAFFCFTALLMTSAQAQQTPQIEEAPPAAAQASAPKISAASIGTGAIQVGYDRYGKVTSMPQGKNANQPGGLSGALNDLGIPNPLIKGNIADGDRKAAERIYNNMDPETKKALKEKASAMNTEKKQEPKKLRSDSGLRSDVKKTEPKPKPQPQPQPPSTNTPAITFPSGVGSGAPKTN
jgi:hypothetical protein